MEKLKAFIATIPYLEEYLYSHSFCDIANDAEVIPDVVREWHKEYMNA